DFALSGIYSLTNKPSQLTAKLTDFNENGLRPFLESALAGRKLVSVAVDGTASAQRNPDGDSAVKADLQVTNLVVNDPAQQLPATPLEARVQLDAGLAKQIADVRDLQITLTPTQRAKNQFQLQGRVDMSRTNAMQGNLKLTADSLDLTSYYDLFTSTNKSSAKPGARNKTQGGAVTPAPEQATAAVTNQLPFKKFTVDANVREFYLREIAATNFQTTVLVDGSHVLMKPFQLTVNGSPLRATADVDMSVPGYKYALTFNATNVPFAPLWNTFKPDQKGEASGTLSANMDVKGVGTTGESLQKTLAGNFDIGTTNLNLDVSKIHSKTLRDIVEFVANVPDFFGPNGISAVEKFGVRAVGRSVGKPSGGLSDDVSRSPIDVITARGTAGDGRVTVQQAVMRSSVFEADVTNGTVKLAQELTNSPINFPVSIYLNKSVAQRVPYLSSANASTNSDYVKIPDVYVEKGTLGEPKPSINTKALGKDVLQQLIPGVGGGTNSSGNLLQGLGGLLHGGSNTNQPAPNQIGTNPPPANNQSPVNNLMNRFLGK
ncbi:MAG TPA: AsmA family protein, partial [Verrucomicrobiae bacterium]